MVSQERTDVFVVGGGPAGLAAALAARQKGFSVIVADGAVPPVDKPCGEGMMPETLAVLRKLGVNLPVESGFLFRGVRFFDEAIGVTADFAEGDGLGIRRPLLHEALVEAAERAGVSLLWKTPVRGLDREGVVLSNRSVRARWIIGADGSGSRVRQWSKLEGAKVFHKRHTRRRHYRIRPWSEHLEVHWGKNAQAYVTAISNQEVCIVMLAERMEDAEFGNALEGMPELRERLAVSEMGSRERGAITAMHWLRSVTRGNVALLGDASGGVDAITGEGLRLAFGQALALADAMHAGDLRGYVHAHRKLMRRPFWMGITLLEMARHAGIRRRAMRVFRRSPELFARLLSFHTGQMTPQAAIRAGARLGWQFLTT